MLRDYLLEILFSVLEPDRRNTGIIACVGMQHAEHTHDTWRPSTAAASRRVVVVVWFGDGLLAAMKATNRSNNRAHHRSVSEAHNVVQLCPEK